MRKSIEEEKNKYVELWGQKEEIVRAVEGLNGLALKYVLNDNVEN
jgi:hypothetical protein